MSTQVQENTLPLCRYLRRIKPRDWLLVIRGPLAGTWLRYCAGRDLPAGAIMLDGGEHDPTMIIMPADWVLAAQARGPLARLRTWLTAWCIRLAVRTFDRQRLDRFGDASGPQSYLDLAGQLAEARLELIETRRQLKVAAGT